MTVVPDGVTLRPAVPDDARGIAHVHMASWLTTYRGLVPDSVLDGLDEAKRAEGWQETLSTTDRPGVDVVAEIGGAIVGFCSGGPSRRKDTPTGAEVYAIYLLAHQQRRGIGGRLWEAVVRHLGRAGPDSLSVTALRDGFACRFYEKNGGTVAAEGTHTVRGVELPDVTYGWRPYPIPRLRRPVEVAPYDPVWADAFERLRARFARALVGGTTRIEHVGSTSVPGLAAKPIIDINVGVEEQRDVAGVIACLERLGYLHEGDLGVPGREALRQLEPDRLPRHHLYVSATSASEFRRHVAFRDHLRAKAEDAAAYGELKLELAQRHRNNIDAYSEAKTEFVEEILTRFLGGR